MKEARLKKIGKGKETGQGEEERRKVRENMRRKKDGCTISY